ncbi:MAG TPA: endonuclease Q family protein [Patescibacteria group bacterium]|nr:endonuclease Q family protein [Patescibacteria group bacterium]
MIDIVADLHLHSKYSRAVSPQMTTPLMAHVAAQKGIELLATGDWTHPVWFRELQANVEEAEEGLFKLKSQTPSSKSQIQNPKSQNGTDENRKEARFLLSTEVATIFSQNGKGRRIHQLIFVPSFATAEKVNKELIKRGFNLSSDGRPIIGLSSKNLLSLLLEIDERSLLIPAHAWTPWFGIYGQMSGFNSLSEAFENLAPHVYGIETGLSSDPEMNWQVDELRTRSILSFSDAHSLSKMGREATIFRLENLSYENIRAAIMQPSLVSSHQSLAKDQRQRAKDQVLYTIEFYPEEGKYHYSGHRNCKITMTPEEQEKANNMCPVCKRRLTDGVMRRVTELSQEKPRGLHKANSKGLVWIADPKNIHPPFVKIVPLQEIIAEAISRPVTSPKVKVIFDVLCEKGISEFHVLLHLSLDEISKIVATISSPEYAARIRDGIQKVREEHIIIQPGFDGVFGTVKIWQEDNDVAKDTDESLNSAKEQIGLGF